MNLSDATFSEGARDAAPIRFRLYQRRGYQYFKWKDIDGRSRRRTATGIRSYAEARLIRSRFLADQVLRVVPTERAKWTLQQAVDQRHIDRKHRIAGSSFASEASIFRTLLRLWLGAPGVGTS